MLQHHYTDDQIYLAYRAAMRKHHRRVIAKSKFLKVLKSNPIMKGKPLRHQIVRIYEIARFLNQMDGPPERPNKDPQQ